MRQQRDFETELLTSLWSHWSLSSLRSLRNRLGGDPDGFGAPVGGLFEAAWERAKFALGGLTECTYRDCQSI